jgi:hypothetical protein
MPTPLPEAVVAPRTLPPPPQPTITPAQPLPTPAPAGWKPEVTGGPMLKVSAESKDAGTLFFEQPVIVGFQLRNVGDAPLVMNVPLVPRLVEGC